MTQTVMLRIQGKQYYNGPEPEVIELLTEGTLEKLENGWEICYEESDMTGMEGVTTVFRVEPEQITLIRKGRLESCMEFRIGTVHESLYRMEFGALLISVCATRIRYELSENGGTVDLSYNIDIEQSAGGVVEYHLEIQTK